MREPTLALAGAAFALGAAAACAAPAASAPSAAVRPPPAWGAGEPDAAPPHDGAALAASFGLDAWWTRFQAADLDAAVAEALAAQPDLAAVAARVEAARAQTRAVAGARLPQAGASLDLSRSRRNLIGLPLPGAPDVLPITSDQHGLGAQVAWEADLSRRLAAAATAAEEDLRALEAERSAFALALAGQVARTWLVLVEQEQRVALRQAQADVAAQRLELARRRLAAGTGAAAEVAAAVAGAEAAAAAIAAARAESASTRSHLAALRGRSAGASAPTAPPLPPLPDPVPAGLPAELLSRRPDLAAAERRVWAARARATQARAELWPRLTLTAGVGTGSNEIGDLLSGDFRVWSLAAGLVQPLFAGGSLRARAASAEALAQASEAEFVAYALRAFAEVEAALAAETALRDAALRLQSAAASWQAEAARAQRRYADGTGDANEMLGVRWQALEAEAAASAAQLATLLNRVDLHLALGGGFAAPPTP